MEAKRKKAKEKIKNDKPFMLIVCPMCGPFSSASNFNYINKTKEEVKDQLEKAMDHINFAVELCIMQLNAGRLFLFEHPAGASTWETKVMKSLRAREGVLRVNFDFCMAGMKIGDKKGDENPVKKRTGLVTNSHALYTLFREAQCRGDHVHAEILSRTAECQVYPEKFCEILCEGVKRVVDDKMAQQAVRRVRHHGDLREALERAREVRAHADAGRGGPVRDALRRPRVP